MNMTQLTNQIREIVKEEGGILSGFGPVERYAELPRKCGPRPVDVYPGAKTVISVAVQMPDACMERAAYHSYDDPESGLVNILVSLRLNLIASKIARHLENNGFTAFPVAATAIWRYRPYKEFDAPFLADISHRHMAVGAGLGEFGWNGLVLTPGYGPRVRLVTVITDAELTPSPMYGGEPLCDKCMRCVNQCGKHIKALTEGTKGKVSFKIGDKLCEYANKNLWYCAWTENFSIRHDIPKPEIFDEEHICSKFKEIVQNHPDWYESWTIEPCWGECLPPSLRKLDPGYSKVPRRIKDVKLKGSRRELTKAVMEKITEICKAKFESVTVRFVDISTDAELAEKYRYFQPDMNTLITVNVPLETYQNISRYIWYQVINLELSIITWLDSMGYGAMQLSFLRNREKDRHLVSRLFEKYNITDKVNHEAGDNKLLEAILTTSDFIEGDSCRIALVGTNLLLDNEGFTAGRGTMLPDNLDLKAEVRSLAKESDIDLIGFADKKRMDALASQLQSIYRDAYRFEAQDLNPGKGPCVPEVKRKEIIIPSINDYLPGAKSVIVLGVHMSEGIIDTKYNNNAEVIGPYVIHKAFLRDLLTEYGYRICERLRLRGYKAVPVIDLFGTASVYTYPIREYRDDSFSSTYAAIAAGLGELGHHGMLLTPQYGVRQLLLSIVTDAVIESDPLYKGAKLCLECKVCVSSCPAKAISSNKNSEIVLEGRSFAFGKLNVNRCDWAKKYCLAGDEGPKYTGSTTDILPPEEVTAENLADALAKIDPIQKDYMLSMEPCFVNCRSKQKL